jgi:hypothetical protein
LTVVVAALVAVPSAQAANPVPNPGFESDCGAAPCDWSAFGGAASVTRDTATSASGSASLHLATDASIIDYAQSSCVGITTGTYGSGIWFRTTDSKVLAVHLAAETFTGGQCDDFLHFGSFPYGASKSLTPADHDGAWHFVSGPIDLSTGDVARFVLSLDCDPCSAGNLAVANFDDVTVGGTPTAVTVTWFKAARSGRDVVVRWRTASEARVLGFRVYRGGRLLTPSILRAQGGVRGHAYAFCDRNAAAPPAYVLEVVRQDGRFRIGPLPLAP